MDDKNVNLTFHQDFKRVSDQSLFQELIDIGVSTLRLVHGALESTFDKNGKKNDKKSFIHSMIFQLDVNIMRR